MTKFINSDIYLAKCKHNKNSVEASLITEEIQEQYYDLNDNQMPYGGATDIHGKIIWKVSKEEHDQMMARIKKAFGKE